MSRSKNPGVFPYSVLQLGDELCCMGDIVSKVPLINTITEGVSCGHDLIKYSVEGNPDYNR